MCARFFLTPDLDEILAILGVTLDDSVPVTPRWNIAPTQDVPVITQTDAGRALASMRWGLVPSWWRDDKLPVFVNARAETVTEKPSFRSAIRSRRSLLPATGFYEWRTEGKAKLPFAITLSSRRPMTMGAIWETWQRGEQIVQSCAVLTTDAEADMRGLHDRQPLILGEQDWAAWLDPDTSGDAVRALLRPYDGGLALTPVGTAVNSVRATDGAWFEA